MRLVDSLLQYLETQQLARCCYGIFGQQRKIKEIFNGNFIFNEQANQQLTVPATTKEENSKTNAMK